MARCFVIQPFDKGPYDRRYADVLKPAIVDAGLEPYRVDEDPKVAVPIDDIESGIRNSQICLADITTNNPNVWYEVGFALANDKRVVMICLEPRPEPFPFDIRHRHIIPYKLQAPSDFEDLKKEVTNRLIAQAEAAEKLQAVAALSQVKNTEGLPPHETATLMTIMSEISTPDEGLSAYRIKQSMERSGYTPMAATIALAGLKRKNMIEYSTTTDYQGEEFALCRLSEKGLEWMVDNQGLFNLRKSDPAPTGPICDEDIPF